MYLGQRVDDLRVFSRKVIRKKIALLYEKEFSSSFLDRNLRRVPCVSSQTGPKDYR